MRDTAMESHPFSKVREKDGAPGTPLIAKNAMSGAPGSSRLEGKPRLEFDHAARQSAACLSKA